MTFYSFDTSAWINGRRDLLPPSNFPSVWERIEETIADGRIRCVDEVMRELGRRDGDAVHQWAKAQTGLFVDLDDDVQRATADVLARHQKLVGVGSGRSGADPFVIALAMVHDGVVVTEEDRGSATKPKIPFVANDLGLECLTLVEFITEEGWRF